MSRSGYHEDHDPWDLIRYRGQVASATRGKRGQRMFRELKAALEAMPKRELIAEQLETSEGQVCALGALGQVRDVDMSKLDPHEPYQVGDAFDIAHQLAAEVVCVNDDEGHWQQTPEQRWTRVDSWVCSQLIPREPSTPPQLGRDKTIDGLGRA